MLKEENLFHESWHRIAKQYITLRASVNVQKQYYRGHLWYVLQDPFSNQYYRLNPNAYRFFSRLTLKSTVEETWEESFKKEPDTTPSQGDIIELLAQLYHANLLHYQLPPDSKKLFEKHRKKQHKMIKSTLTNIMFFKIPLFDPDRFLNAIKPIINIMISPFGALIWIGMMIYGGMLTMENFGGLKDQSQAILSVDNLPLLYLAMVIIKSLHELGHCFFVKKYGGEVHTLGVMFLILNPVPFMDASASWFFRNKWHRVLVGFGGMIFEVFIGAIALIVWSQTGSGLINSIAYNMILIATLSTVIFNINPLLRFDGYYILSDWLDMPNLHQHAKQHLTHLLEKYVFGKKNSITPAKTLYEAGIFTFFGIFSNIYRIIVFGTILFFIADKFLLLGLAIAAVCFVSWIILPVVKFFKYILNSPDLERQRRRAVTTTGTITVALLILLCIIPFPYSFKSPGVLKAINYQHTMNKTSGFVTEVFAKSGQYVLKDTPLVQLKNDELAFQIEETEASLAESEILRQKAMYQSQADITPIESRIEFFEKRLEKLREEERNLTLKAEMDGIWVAPHARNLKGMWLIKGASVGEIVDETSFYFISVVSQMDVAKIFGNKNLESIVRLSGEAHNNVEIKSYTSIPYEQSDLPSASLGMMGGGEIAVDMKSEGGERSAEPFYEVRAIVDSESDSKLVHGRSGNIKFDLGYLPLASQGWLKVRQVMQKRFKI